MDPDLILMQGSAPGHSAQDTITDLNECGICLILWPAFSPDLNQIEMVWDRMKDYTRTISLGVL